MEWLTLATVTCAIVVVWQGFRIQAEADRRRRIASLSDVRLALRAAARLLDSAPMNGFDLGPATQLPLEQMRSALATPDLCSEDVRDKLEDLYARMSDVQRHLLPFKGPTPQRAEYLARLQTMVKSLMADFDQVLGWASEELRAADQPPQLRRGAGFWRRRLGPRVDPGTG